MGKIVDYEIKKLCSDRVSSIQQSKTKDSICCFPWDEIRTEIAEHCPVLYSLLLNCTNTDIEKSQHIICTIVCMICKFHRSNMSLLQRLVSTLLYAGHVGTGVCLSHT